ncbi:hypothetical protein [Fangia hongkongensis]|uniref:hypothetical protein n=2 Tax=Fangia hongkongensis TaxID=270495 RepID=UPI0003810F2F|nr:hypothetical protein [Fangia hongkongensis]
MATWQRASDWKDMSTLPSSEWQYKNRIKKFDETAKVIPKAQYYVDDKKSQTVDVYKIQKNNQTIGIAEMNNFYFIFDMNKCMTNQDDRALDMSTIKGWELIAHGSRSDVFLRDDPFTPPSGDWDVHFGGPYGAIAITSNSSMRDGNRYQAFGSWTRKNDKNEHKIYSKKDSKVLPVDHVYSESLYKYGDKDKKEAPKNFTRKGSANQLQKIVSGTNGYKDKLMDIHLSTFDKDFDIIYSNIQNKDMGAIYTRDKYHGEVQLSDCLKDIAKLKLERNVGMMACRGTYKDRKMYWWSPHNEGPQMSDLLQGKENSATYNEHVINSGSKGDYSEQDSNTSLLFGAFVREDKALFERLCKEGEVDFNHKLNGRNIRELAVEKNKIEFIDVLDRYNRLIEDRTLNKKNDKDQPVKNCFGDENLEELMKKAEKLKLRLNDYEIEYNELKYNEPSSQDKIKELQAIEKELPKKVTIDNYKETSEKVDSLKTGIKEVIIKELRNTPNLNHLGELANRLTPEIFMNTSPQKKRLVNNENLFDKSVTSEYKYSK